jgi:hypothetical protein
MKIRHSNPAISAVLVNLISLRVRKGMVMYWHLRTLSHQPLVVSGSGAYSADFLFSWSLVGWATVSTAKLRLHRGVSCPIPTETWQQYFAVAGSGLVALSIVTAFDVPAQSLIPSLVHARIWQMPTA